MKIKVCGLRDPDNIAAVAKLPVDYLGFLFYPKSPRFVEGETLLNWLERNKKLIAGIPRVGVFVNAEIDYILNVVHDYELNYVQLHGNESPTYCQELNLLWTVSSMHKARLIKAFSVDEDFRFSSTDAYAPHCPLFLFDTRSAKPGGSGRQWDWSLLDRYHGVTPFLLSGGIGPEDAERVRAVRRPQFHGIDLNSRFEMAPGVKDVAVLEVFLREIGRIGERESG